MSIKAAEFREHHRHRHRGHQGGPGTAAWLELAEGLQAALGGPTPPWPVEIQLADDTWRALQAAAGNQQLVGRDLHRVRVIVASLAKSGLAEGVDPMDLTMAEEIQLSWQVTRQRTRASFG